jgi:hypothetical protein
MLHSRMSPPGPERTLARRRSVSAKRDTGRREQLSHFRCIERGKRSDEPLEEIFDDGFTTLLGHLFLRIVAEPLWAPTARTRITGVVNNSNVAEAAV